MKYGVLILLLSLSGCASNPELIDAIAAGMRAGGEAIQKETDRMNQQTHEQNIQDSRRKASTPMPMPMTCYTTYNRLFRAYETSCM